jgi:geranylgeranyl reductase family protein
MSAMRFDVAVVGAGPAGVWCAHQLAAAGVRVAILDGSHPREKPCGGGVTGRALALVGRHGALEGATVIDAATFVHGGRRSNVSLASPSRQSRLAVFARRDFDQQLLERARGAGAILVPERVTALARDGGTWCLSTRGGSVEANWMVGADGANSFVRKRLSHAFARSDLSIACGYFVHGRRSTQIEVEFVARPAGYLWSFPRPGHLAVGIGAQADETSVTELMAIVDGWVGARVKPPSDARLERYSWPIPSLTVQALERERPCGDRWLLAGDAAGLVDPITREGIFFALQSGAFAAQSLLSSSQPSRTYEERLRAEIFPELLRAARLKAKFFRPAFVGLLLRALERSERVRAVMADLVAGEQSYESLRPRLIKTLEFKLMWELAGLQRT